MSDGSKPRKKMGAAGHARERQVMHGYRDEGFVAWRTPASLGVCDVVAIRRRALVDGGSRGALLLEGSEVLMVEVKANKGSPYKSFLPADRIALRIAAAVAGATALLVHWPPNGQRADIPVKDWPADGGPEAPRGRVDTNTLAA